MSRLNTFARAISTGPLTRFVGSSYNGVVATELALHRTLDARTVQTSDSEFSSMLTAVVKTFERPKILKRLVKSVRRFYPELPMIVADDSENPIELEGVETVILPYNSGVSAGRNAGMELVKTPYVLLLDDDFIFFRHTRLEPVLEAMDQNPEIDLIGGEVVNLPFFQMGDYRRANLFPTTAESIHPPGSRIGGLEVFDKVANFFIARTDRLKLIEWDPALRLLEHADFFTRAKGVLTTVYDPDFKVLHAQTRFDRKYMEHRTDYAVDQAVLRYKYRRKIDH